MTNLHEVEAIVAGLSRSEKAHLLSLIARDLAAQDAGVEVTAGVSGGEPRIAGTRIPIWLLEQARRLGASEAYLLWSYPSLRAQDLVNAWAYVAGHADEIAQQILDNEAA